MTLMIDKNKFLFIIKTILILVLLILFSTQSMSAVSSNDPMVRIADMTRIEGMRTNQLSGYGLVIGLNGSGDSSSNQATVQSIANVLDEYGIEVGADQVESQNVAAVIVTATLPAYAYSGDQIDVTVNSIGDADSLQGGTLLQTPLEAANGDIYAVAQGPVSIGGYNVEGGGGNSQRQNHPTVGMIPSGALVEREIEANLNKEEFTYILNQPNFTTARYMAQAINDQFEYLNESSKIAKASSPARVKVDVPSEYEDEPVNFISQVNNLEVRSSMNAKIVINERTGTIVMGHNVRISTVSVAHGNLTVTISTTEEVSQPEPLSEGETETTEETDITVEEEEGHMTVVESKGTIQDLVTALNTIGATPRDIIAIIQQIKAAGALHAELEIQ